MKILKNYLKIVEINFYVLKIRNKYIQISSIKKTHGVIHWII